MTIQDKKQEEFIEILSKHFYGIVKISVRIGKCRILLNSIKKRAINYIENPKILVLYPNIDIKASWEKECSLISYHPNITYCTFISISKVLDDNWDFIVIDEAHLLSENQLNLASELVKRHSNVILASGTYSNSTLKSIQEATGMDLLIDYPTEQAIVDGILLDFRIFIHEYKLDDVSKREFGKVKKWFSTEQKECNRLSRKVDTSYGNEKKFHAINRMRFINSCNSMINAVNIWIKDHQNERFIIFTGDSNIGAKFGIPMYNSKTDDVNLEKFQKQEINQLCLIRKGKTGITYKNLNTILLTSIDSNGENLEQALGRSLIKDTDEAKIHIFVSNQPFQQKWLLSALNNISEEKIIKI